MLVRFTGWKVGYGSIKLEKFLVSHAGLGLTEAKTLADKIPEGQSFEIDIPHFGDGHREELGAAMVMYELVP